MDGHSDLIRFKNVSLPSYPEIKLVVPSINKICNQLKNFKPHLIHVQSPGLVGLHGIYAAKKLKKPLIGTYHTMVAEQVTYLSPYRLLKIDKLYRFIRKNHNFKANLGKLEKKKTGKFGKKIIQKISNLIYSKMDLIITPSQIIKKILKAQGIDKPMRVISNGIDLSAFQMKAKSDYGKPQRILHIGRIAHEKNVHVVLNAFAIIQKEINNIQLDIIGSGPALAELIDYSRKLNLTDNVHFKGYIPRIHLPAIYPEYDLFMTASTMETQGLVALEAIASGLPCVGVKAYALPELIQEGINGHCAEPFNEAQMARFALAILKNKEKFLAYSRAGIKIAGNHDLRFCAMKLARTYKKTIQEKK
jgi:glycosyltransferase involved in cell wall biosynthesis